MRRIVLAAIGAAFCLAIPAFAAENSGTFVRYESAKKVLTIKSEDKESEYQLSDAVKLLTTKGEPCKQGIELFADRQRAKIGAPLTVVTERRNGKEIVVEIKLGKSKK
ncbi:MAG TPA: hypothetical protein VKS79_20685 [Gemmataceae bacterium]|nr:hypothetical protein [Gemmataceae bacterium]